MIDAILTGMTGRISTLNRVPTERPAKEESVTQKTPQNLDNISLSKEARELYESNYVNKSKECEKGENCHKGEKAHKGNKGEYNPAELTEEEQKELQELKARDQEVKTHEQAHMAAGAPYTSAPSYEYTTGPDNQQYATGGEVNVDTSEEATPEKTIEKAQVIKRSASAPAEPSSQDKKVAAQAAQLESKARAELAESKQDEKKSTGMPLGMAQYMQTSAPTTGSLINMSF